MCRHVVLVLGHGVTRNNAGEAGGLGGGGQIIDHEEAGTPGTPGQGGNTETFNRRPLQGEYCAQQFKILEAFLTEHRWANENLTTSVAFFIPRIS